MSAPYEFREGPWENSEAPSLIKDNPTGGDPLMLGTLARINRPDEIYEMVRLANLAAGAIAAGYKFE